jgi:hypothetical protein
MSPENTKDQTLLWFAVDYRLHLFSRAVLDGDLPLILINLILDKVLLHLDVLRTL